MEVLDIFAGSGSLGIEALSMGAKFATFIDKSPTSINCIKDNLSKCNFTSQSIVVNKDFSAGTRLLIKNNKKYDLIFADPPYSYFDDKTLNGIIRTALKLSSPGGIIVCEHPKEEKIVLDVKNRVKVYKDKFITFCWKS
jgi:16S rRNA (guanine(966)-N(2))-methyltransferase RsmD